MTLAWRTMEPLAKTEETALVTTRGGEARTPTTIAPQNATIWDDHAAVAETARLWATAGLAMSIIDSR